MVENCVFCKLMKSESINKIYENDNFISFPDMNQKMEGHSLVISKKHFTTILDLPNSIGSELLDAIKVTAVKLMDKTKSTGFNIVQNNFEDAGQVVKHVHFHILPRRKGDKTPLCY